ncbi:MAG: hypothetical protein JWM90_2601 [Thermoleophilia bacterium]|nr:hypothetical protein [Thermoleophilia bacterium]
MTRLHKIHTGLELDHPHVHGDTWSWNTTTSGQDRLVIAPSGRHIALMQRLAEVLEPPFFLLFVLSVPRGDDAAGRYQSPPLERDVAHAILDRFSDFFEQDARHNIWLASADGSSMLVYDEHDVIYAYGPFNEMIDILEAEGLREGPHTIPDPHGHPFHPEFDDAQHQLVSVEEFWHVTPLQPQDER